nr:MAG: hypothetical protein [Caudoviricetes sp.]
MIITKTVQMKISSSNMNYWRNLGYQFENPAPRWGIIPIIEVKVEDLQINSCVYVDCKCDNCGKEYKNRYSRRTDLCKFCNNSEKMVGNNFGTKNKGKSLECMKGENHPRWNPNKPAFQKYYSEVRSISEKSYNENIDIINPNRYPRRLCGVKGGYQLDHIISIKEGFENNISPDIIGGLDNLQILSWEENRAKWHK